MPYVIYELVASPSLTRLEEEGEQLVVCRLNRWKIHERHASFERAYEEIDQYKEELRNMQFVVLPTISVDYKGEIE
jgi:hypothetical protein